MIPYLARMSKDVHAACLRENWHKSSQFSDLSRVGMSLVEWVQILLETSKAGFMLLDHAQVYMWDRKGHSLIADFDPCRSLCGTDCITFALRSRTFSQADFLSAKLIKDPLLFTQDPTEEPPHGVQYFDKQKVKILVLTLHDTSACAKVYKNLVHVWGM